MARLSSTEGIKDVKIPKVAQKNIATYMSIRPSFMFLYVYTYFPSDRGSFSGETLYIPLLKLD